MDLAEFGAVFRIIWIGGSGRTWNAEYSSVVCFAILIVALGRPCSPFDVKVVCVDGPPFRLKNRKNPHPPRSIPSSLATTTPAPQPSNQISGCKSRRILPHIHPNPKSNHNI